MASSSTPVTTCQICGCKQLSPIIFVGYIPPVNTMPSIGVPPVEEPSFPLELLRCDDCGLVQIGLEVSQEVLFPESYPYLSSSTRILRENFANQYREVAELVGLRHDDLVIDVGSNDGTLLDNYHQAGHPVLGIEPSQAADVAIGRGIRTRKTYFSLATATQVRQEFGPARVVTACNVFAHIADVHAVVDGIVAMLGDDGVFVSESHYLADLVETLQYDTIYHEHLRYYHLGALIRLLGEHGLEVFHVRRIPTHGGSIRVFAGRRGQRPIMASVAECVAREDAQGITDGRGLADFRNRVIASKLNLYALLAPIKASGARIYGIGAPSRASTLINYVGLDDGVLDAVMEISTSHKLNKYVPGTRIPVLDEKKLFVDQPEFALLLSWHIADELAPILRKNGYRGKFIVPLPTPRVLDA
ncbi:methyltransferase [Bradyrhizobium sp. CCBAU 11386]|uniref:class I SAM-dependent methyltransferase n=1 Tax=Bradyrhizobium sp. CCBAU 11386 TaxID=1630837 RepID=UPI002303657A|nr:class I SAM-dependent methyltransferase [Bradyrhizobium sp. CCBAU 11386]MDA9508850.1 methyltransferase [Bradyrhizobium sp. CCBAU 11386]